MNVIKSVKLKISKLNTRSIHVAIIGSGPSGFYAADQLIKSKLPNLHVHMFEKLPTPYGLVRYGVAPDHPEVKTVESTFETIAQSKNFLFFGNINVGNDLTIPELQKNYNAIIMATGAENDRHLEIPGENLKGVYGARYA